MSFFTAIYQYMAALPAQCGGSTFFDFPRWYEYLDMHYEGSLGGCVVDDFKLLGAGADSGLILIALAILDMLLRFAGLVAVGYVAWGGIKYLTSRGEPSELAAAKQTITNALVGVVIALVATSVVVFIGTRLSS